MTVIKLVEMPAFIVLLQHVKKNMLKFFIESDYEIITLYAM